MLVDITVTRSCARVCQVLLGCASFLTYCRVRFGLARFRGMQSITQLRAPSISARVSEAQQRHVHLQSAKDNFPKFSVVVCRLEHSGRGGFEIAWNTAGWSVEVSWVLWPSSHPAYTHYSSLVIRPNTSRGMQRLVDMDGGIAQLVSRSGFCELVLVRVERFGCGQSLSYCLSFATTRTATISGSHTHLV